MTATVLDVLENFFDGDLGRRAVEQSRPRRLRELTDLLGEYHARWRPPELDRDEVRLSYAGWSVRGNGFLAPTGLGLWDGARVPQQVGTWLAGYDWLRWEMTPSESAEAHADLVRQFTLRTMGVIFAHRVVDADPLDGWDARRPGARGALIVAMRLLADTAPLLRDTTLVLVPQSASVPLPNIVEDAHDGRVADYALLRQRLLLAASASAQLLPLYPDETRALFRNIAAKANARVVHALTHVDLPFLRPLPLKEVVRVRKSEDAFADWRTQLRLATRSLRSDVGDDDFAEEARGLLADILEPAADRARRAASRSQALQLAVGEQIERVAIGAAATGGAAAILSSSPAAGLLGAGLTALGSVALRTLFPARGQGGQARVIIELTKAAQRHAK
jgi:hypothetical protein